MGLWRTIATSPRVRHPSARSGAGRTDRRCLIESKASHCEVILRYPVSGRTSNTSAASGRVGLLRYAISRRR